MGGGGTIAAMRASLKANEIKRDRNRYIEKGGYFKKTPKIYRTTEVKKLYSKELSKKERKRIRMYSSNDEKKEKMLNSVIITLSIFLTFFIIYLIVSTLTAYYLKA